nr:MAG: ORF1 [TTV-like mini virus]
MPWWYKRRYPWRRRRWRWRRRPRRTFRRGFYRRYRVRSKTKRKLAKLTLKQWQPEKIQKLRIKGLYPLFLTNHQRVTNNMIQYLDSIAPQYYPGGGGFSIIKFTLQCLYEQFIKSTNWWTNTNCNLPLIRYNGCTIKLYATEKYDYIVHIDRCYPLYATDLMYMGCQPSILMLTKKAIFVPCRQSNPRRKQYKKVFIRPPTQMSNKWMFQQDFANTTLFVLRASVCSFDRYYTSSNASSTTAGFTSLNCNSFTYHNWNQPPTTGYRPNSTQYLYSVKWAETDTIDKVLQKHYEDLIYLGGTGPYTLGTSAKDSGSKDTYMSKKQFWGNIFHPKYLTGSIPVLVTTKSPTEIQQKITSASTTNIQENFTVKPTANITQCRYNPFADKGVGNLVFLTKNTGTPEEWAPPHDEKLERANLPIWLCLFGFLDWQKKLNEVQNIDTYWLCVIKSPYITPAQTYYLPLDKTFLQGYSPYSNQLTTPDDKFFYPKCSFQVQAINELGSTGPGIVKLPPAQSCEAHFKYNFHFKLGGCPAPMEKICNPVNQPKYPVPDTKSATPSLQSPETALQTFLYSFDERQGLLTQTAAKRIKTHHGTQKLILPFTGAATDLQTPPERTSEEETSDSEKEEENIQLQLQHLRKQQHKLKQRILRLMDQQNLE